MTLNYKTPEQTLRPQKIAALLTAGSGAAMIVAIRLFTIYYPGPNPMALMALFAGIVFAIVGIIWYIVIRKAES